VALEFSARGGAAQDPPARKDWRHCSPACSTRAPAPMIRARFIARSRISRCTSASAPIGSLSGHLQTLSRNVDQAFALLKLALNDARFDADAIERVRGSSRPASSATPTTRCDGRQGVPRGRLSRHPYGRRARANSIPGGADALRPRSDARPPVRARQSQNRGGRGIDAATLAARLDETFAVGPSAATSRP